VARPVDPVKLPDCQLNWEAIDKRTSALEAIEPVRKIGATGQPAFQGAWVNYDNGLTVPGGGTQRDAGFYRHLGHVYLFGVVKSGTSGTTVFTLPVGYRPTVSAVSLPPLPPTARPRFGSPAAATSNSPISSHPPAWRPTAFSTASSSARRL
jgi:hypothetical protein